MEQRIDQIKNSATSSASYGPTLCGNRTSEYGQSDDWQKADGFNPIGLSVLGDKTLRGSIHGKGISVGPSINLDRKRRARTFVSA